ncbi:MAG: DUF805 domain-containing protein [Caulobacter sp.]|nr:DUF805 domain-containing protein [Caulobacter sp.]
MGFLRGRTNRATYWLSLGVVATLIAITALVFHQPVKVSEILLIIVCVPRLHDIGRSGWIAGGVFIAEIVAIILAALLLHDEDGIYAVGGVAALIIGGLLIWLGCIPSDKVSNAYGGPPKPGIGFDRSA